MFGLTLALIGLPCFAALDHILDRALWTDATGTAISNVVVNLASGTVSAASIQVGPYWYVVRLNAKRPFQVPGFEENKALVPSAAVQSRRAALLKRLSDAAVVK